MGKLKSFVKGAAVTGAVAGGALFAAGNVFTYLSLTPNGVKKLNGGKPIDPVINEIYANSVENRIGGEWFDEKDPERLFTFNKYSDCLHAYYIKADEPSDIYVTVTSPGNVRVSFNTASLCSNSMVLSKSVVSATISSVMPFGSAVPI